MVTFSPYVYNWSVGNSSYQIRTLTEALRTIGLKYASLAFVIGDGFGGINPEVKNSVPDILTFQKEGGTVILSFGGANGPYLEDTMGIDQMYNIIIDLLTTTGIRHIDYDIEGIYLVNETSNSKRNAVLKRLQQTIPELYVSFTLPVEAPSRWGSGGLNEPTLKLVKDAIASGVRIDIVNLMTMNYYGSADPNAKHGRLACEISEVVKNQLRLIYPLKSEAELYKMIGLTPMIGLNDDGTTFTADDARVVTDYAINKNIGLMSYWALQRDQIGSGGLAIYSQVNTQHHEFFNIFKRAQTSSLPITSTNSATSATIDQANSSNVSNVLGNAVPGVVSGILSNVVPGLVSGFVPNSQAGNVNSQATNANLLAWSAFVLYKIGDIVTFGGNFYKCRIPHTSLVGWEPTKTPALWEHTSAPPVPTTPPTQPVPATPPTQPVPATPPTQPVAVHTQAQNYTPSALIPQVCNCKSFNTIRVTVDLDFHKF